MPTMDQDPAYHSYTTTAELQATFVDFFDGYVFTEIDLLRSSVRSMKRARLHFSDQAERTEQALEQSLGEPGEYIASRECLAAGLLAYVYSGVIVEKSAVLMAAELAGKTQGWIKQTAWPTEKLLRRTLEISDKDEQGRIRRIAYGTLRQICTFSWEERYRAWRNKP